LVDQLGLLRREAKQLQKDLGAAADPAEYLKLNRALEQNRERQKDVTASIREQKKAQQEQAQFAEGSYAQLNSQLVKLRRTFRELSAADREGKIGQGAIEQIQRLDRELKDLDASVGQYQRNVGNYESAFSGFAGTLLQIGAVAEVAQFFDPNALIQQGIAIDNLDQKARTVFGETLPKVTKEAEKNAAALGLTSREYINAAAQIQDLLVPMGFTRDAASDISIELQNLSGALSEWTGGQKSSSEVSDILSAALLGERDSLKSLGISIAEADVQAQLAAKGQEELTGAALQQAQAQATLDLVLQKSTDAQAAFAAGADSPIRQLNLLKAQVTTLAEAVAEGATPAISSLIRVMLGLSNFVGENKTALLAGAAAVGTYAVAVNTATIATKGAELATKAAALAQTILNNAIKAAPYVAVATAVFALTKLIVDYVAATNEASVTTKTVAESAERLNTAITDGTAQLARETNEIRANFGVLKSETATREQKAEAIRKLKAEYPDLLRSYNLEKGNLQDIEKAEKAIIRARAEKIAQRVGEAEIETLTKNLLQANQELATVQQQATKINEEVRKANADLLETQQEATGQARLDLIKAAQADKARLDERSREQQQVLKQAQQRVEAIKGQITAVGESTALIADQLTTSLKDVPVTAAKAGEDTGKNIVAGAIDGTQKGLETVKEEQVRTLATLEAELAKYREQFAALDDKNLAPLNLINALESLPREIASVQEKIKELQRVPLAVRFKPPNFDEEELDDRPLEIPVKPTVTPRTLAMVREELAKVQTEIQSFGNQDLVSTETIQRFESLTNEVERLERALATLNGTSDETAKATDEVAKDSEEQIKGIGRKRKVTREEIEAALIQASIDAAQAGADAIFEIENNNLERITEKKLAQLEQDEAAQLALVEGNAIAEQQVREDFQAQREQLEREAFEKKKQLDTAQAIMNAALAITQVFATTPFPLNLIAAAVVGVQTAAQIATIQAQEYARGGLIRPGEVVPKAESGIFVGPSHARGGINTRLSGRLVNVEGGEYYERLADGSSVVINKRSTSRFASALRAQAGKNYAGKLQALSVINEMGGGVPLYATGGLIAPMGNPSADRQSTAQTELLAMALSRMEARVPVLTLQSFDTVNARANQVKTLQGL
jgi:hypothetical protein